jgi:hypothetical protein
MTAAEKLRLLIKEEVRKAVKQEMGKLLKENNYAKSSYQSTIESQVKSKVPPISLNTIESKKQAIPRFDKSNPFSQMLNETALSFSTDDVHGFGGGGFQQRETAVGDVSAMLSSAKKSTNIDMVSIDTVPDFSGLMSKMKERGEI